MFAIRISNINWYLFFINTYQSWLKWSKLVQPPLVYQPKITILLHFFDFYKTLELCFIEYNCIFSFSTNYLSSILFLLPLTWNDEQITGQIQKSAILMHIIQEKILKTCIIAYYYIWSYYSSTNLLVIDRLTDSNK